jgi:hypothetical protein
MLISELFISWFTKNEDDPGIAEGGDDTGVKSGRACPSAEAEGSQPVAWQLSTLEEVMERQLACNFLPVPLKFCVTNQRTLSHSSNFGTLLSVVIIVIHDSNDNVGVLKKLSQMPYFRCLTSFTLENC